MRTLLKPHWLLLVNTLPIGLLLLLGAGEYGVIHTLLPPISTALWQQLALVLSGLGLAMLAAGGLAWRAGRPLGVSYAVVALLAFGTYMGWCLSHESELLPRDVPRWMVPTDVVLYVWTFLMPTLIHALLVLVLRTTPGERPHGALLSFLLALAVPLVGVVLVQALAALGQPWLSRFEEGVLFVALLTVVPATFLYFLVRMAYILTLRRAPGELGLVWKLLLSFLLPLIGLALNASLGGRSLGGGVFGDFSSPWFFGLAVGNSALLCLPAADFSPRWRLALLAGRSALLGYTAYFFLVFLPFLPLSVLAIVLLGTGFLLLAPLLLLVLHLHELRDDVVALRPRFGWGPVLAALLGGAAVLPLAVTASYYHERQVLHQALAYAYSPDYDRRYDLDAEALARTLSVVRQHKEPANGFWTGAQQPYLSTYFNWLVLDNLTLSEAKIAELEKLFLNGPAHPDRWPTATFINQAANQPAAPALRQLRARSTYDARQQAWVSRVDLEIANPDPTQRRGEYATTFFLPPGCWVSDYYLDLNGRREPGLLAEQKAADWLYRQVVRQDVPRDPGLLTYADPTHLSLRVYPVAGAAPRRTGFELLHREPLTLSLDGQAVRLGRAGEGAASAAAARTPGGAVCYLGPAAKRALPLVRRQPYYHFLLDVSAGQYQRKADYQRWIASFLAVHPAAAPPRFTLVNTYSTPVPAGADWARQLNEFPNAGGYYLSGALRRTLADAWQHPAGTYPVLVAVTDSLPRAVLAGSFTEFAPAFPEGPAWLVLGAGGRVEAHSLLANARQAAPGLLSAAIPAVRAWPSATQPRAYLPADDQPAVVLADPAAPAAPTASPTTSRWATGLLLRGASQWQVLHPAEANAQHPALVRASFRAHLLSPWTAFLALENEAQRAALRRKQAQTMAANANLDAMEEDPAAATAVPLDDYTGWLLLLAVGAGWWRVRPRRAVA